MKVQSEKGFTLLEVVIVGVLLTLIAAIAIPRMSFLFEKNRLRSSTSTVTSSLYLARMKAVNDGEDIGVQFYDNGEIKLVSDPLGANVEINIVNRLEEGISFLEVTFENWMPIFTSFGQLEKTCLPEGDLIGYIDMVNDKGDTTTVEVGLVTGRIKETNL